MSLKALIFVCLPICAAPYVEAVAEPLDKESCVHLQSERRQMLSPDMQKALDQGPDWVKSHLDEPDIDRVRQFLTIEEEIEFRCRGGGVAKAALKPDVPPTGSIDVPLPDRKPTRPVSAEAASKASQALADSDKTAPSKAKATR